MQALVIDLRDNPGGIVDSATDVLDRILPTDKLLVYTVDKNNTKEEYYSADDEKIELPIAVLINENSASASEIVSGCLQDYEKATLVGVTSFGKGIVQSVLPLKDGSAIKVTIAKYYTPSMTEIHKIGIEPDVVIDLPDELKKTIRIPHKDDTQLQEAVKQLGGAPLTDD
jgi:carboxyl-terminal processing protease